MLQRFYPDNEVESAYELDYEGLYEKGYRGIIFDIDNTSVSRLTRDFLRKKQDAGRVVNVTNEIPKAFIVCQAPDGRETVYLSQLAAATLKKRSGRL